MSGLVVFSAFPDYVGGFLTSDSNRSVLQITKYDAFDEKLLLVKVIGFCVLVKKPVKNTIDNIILCKDCYHFKPYGSVSKDLVPKELVPK